MQALDGTGGSSEIRGGDPPPEGWTMVQLADLTGPSTERAEPETCPDVPYLSLEHIEAGTGRILGCGVGADVTSTKTVFRAGDVLYGKLRPYLNKVCTPTFQGICSTDILVFPRSPSIDGSYLRHVLSRRETVEFANHRMTGIQLPRISFEKLGELTVPLPPLAEQRRIVAQVASLLTLTATASDRLARALIVLKRFRQAILIAACSGRLTEAWREARANSLTAAELLAQIRRERRSDEYLKSETLPDNLPDLPATWVRATIGRLADIATGATPLRTHREFFEGGHIPWVTSGAVNELFVRHASQFITDLALAETNAKIFPAGTLLVAMYGEGKTRGKVSELAIDAATNQALAALRFSGTAAGCKAYLKLFLRKNYEETRELSAGGVQPNLSLGIVRSMTVPLPPIDEQHEIVSRVEALFTLADAIERRTQAATAQTQRLTQAILAKAFRGELVPTEAELARQEGRGYESASALLACVAEARARSHDPVAPRRSRNGRARRPLAGPPANMSRFTPARRVAEEAAEYRQVRMGDTTET